MQLGAIVVCSGVALLSVACVTKCSACQARHTLHAVQVFQPGAIVVYGGADPLSVAFMKRSACRA